MAFIPALIAGVAGLAGGLLNKPQTTTGSQNSNMTGSQTVNQSMTGSSSQNPQYDQLGSSLRAFLGQQYLSRASQTPDFMNQYQNSGIQAINSGANSSRQALQQILAARGLSNSPAAATSEAGQEANRIGQITQFNTQLPLVQDQLQQQRLQQLGGFFQGLPVGSTSTTEGQQEGQTNTQQNTQGNFSQTGPNNSLGGAVGGLGGMLAYLYGKGGFGGGSSGPTSGYQSRTGRDS